MATAEELMAVIGSEVDSDNVRALIAADRLLASVEENLEDGEPQREYLANHGAGYQLMHHSGRVSTAFLYIEPAEGFAAFPGPLPGGLLCHSTRFMVRHLFGIPERSGEPGAIPGLGKYGAWDRFAFGAVRIHFQYTSPEQRIRLVTLMTSEDAP